MTWCPGNHQPCPVPAPLTHHILGEVSSGPIRPSQAETGVCGGGGGRKAEPGAPSGDGKCSPPAKPGSVLLPPPHPTPPPAGRTENGQGQVLTQMIWVPEQLIIPRGAGLVQNFLLPPLPLRASGESGVLLHSAMFSPDCELFEGRSGSQHPAQGPAHSRYLRRTGIWSL